MSTAIAMIENRTERAAVLWQTEEVFQMPTGMCLRRAVAKQALPLPGGWLGEESAGGGASSLSCEIKLVAACAALRVPRRSP